MNILVGLIICLLGLSPSIYCNSFSGKNGSIANEVLFGTTNLDHKMSVQPWNDKLFIVSKEKWSIQVFESETSFGAFTEKVATSDMFSIKLAGQQLIKNRIPSNNEHTVDGFPALEHKGFSYRIEGRSKLFSVFMDLKSSKMYSFDYLTEEGTYELCIFDLNAMSTEVLENGRCKRISYKLDSHLCSLSHSSGYIFCKRYISNQESKYTFSVVSLLKIEPDSLDLEVVWKWEVGTEEYNLRGG
eukprot:TRINITY_DN778272_c0_g1_i1.p1 TRINITY_DN778272_c0_g1~~TRINITY_DN778272_c0_g1_i1.p1  ORF type:complete len:243 (-),score=40.76 TRINITY_DN778272_c0_g1_i1:60-788(-)